MAFLRRLFGRPLCVASDRGQRSKHPVHSGLNVLTHVLGALTITAIVAEPVMGAPTEYQVKAVFLFNFSRFVDWPPPVFTSPDAPFVIGVLGHDPFGSDLDEVVKGETVNGHPLAVRRFSSVNEVDDCHILYISRSEQRQLDPILGKLKGRSVLTVGDEAGFAQRGGMINLDTQRNRVRLSINLKQAEAAGLKISSKLLRPAQIVEPRES